MIGLRPPTAGNNIIHNIFFTVEVHLYKTHKTFQMLSYHTDVVRGGSLSYSYNFTRAARQLCNYHLSCKVAFFSPLNSFTGRNFGARTLRFFLIWKLIILFSHSSLWFIIFNLKIMRFLCRL